MSVRSAVRAVVVSVLALATVPALVPGVAHAATKAVNCPGDDLQTAITAAAAGDTLDVTGTCVGNFAVDKDLTLHGDGSTVLDGAHAFTTIRIFPQAAHVDLNDLTVTGGNAVAGGGMYIGGTTTVTFTRATVSGNTASAGGGIYNTSGHLFLVDSTVSGNTATGSDAVGGGIFDNIGPLTVVDSTVSANTAAGSDFAAGGGMLMGIGTLTMTNSTVSGNTASATGGSTARGGGIDSAVSTATIFTTTIAGNAVTSPGVAVGGGISGNISSTATLIAGNTATGTTVIGPDCNAAGVLSGGYNLVGNTSGCSGLVGTDLQNVDPMLDSLKDNGGPTKTMGLLKGSPAIGAIPLTGGGACLVGQATDQRGVPRPQGKGCDIGAVEKGRTTTRVASSVNPSTLGQPVTFTATVCANPSSLPATPAGTVQFRDGGTGPFLGSPVALAPGGGTRCAQAQLTTSALPMGRGQILGIYSGDGVNTKSRGGVLHKVKAEHRGGVLHKVKA